MKCCSLMNDAKTDNTTVILDNNNYQFKATGQVITFDGYLKVYSEYEDTVEKELPSKTEYVIKLQMSEWQKIVYQQIKEQGLLAEDPSTGRLGKKALMNTYNLYKLHYNYILSLNF